MKRLRTIAGGLLVVAAASAATATGASAAPRLYLENPDETVILPGEPLGLHLNVKLQYGGATVTCALAGNGHVLTNGMPTDALSFAAAPEGPCGGRISGGETVAFKFTAAKTMVVIFTAKLAVEVESPGGLGHCVYELRRMEGWIDPSVAPVLLYTAQGAAPRNPRRSEYHCPADALAELEESHTQNDIFEEGVFNISEEVRPA